MNTGDTGIAVIVGALLPMIIAVIVQTSWTDAVKSVVAFLLCVVATAVTAVVTGAVSLSDPGFDWVTFFGAVWGTAMVSYQSIYKPTGVTRAIETNTSK